MGILRLRTPVKFDEASLADSDCSSSVSWAMVPLDVILADGKFSVAPTASSWTPAEDGRAHPRPSVSLFTSRSGPAAGPPLVILIRRSFYVDSLRKSFGHGRAFWDKNADLSIYSGLLGTQNIGAWICGRCYAIISLHIGLHLLDAIVGQKLDA